IDQLALISVDELVDAIDVSFDQANDILERAHRLLAQKHAREAREAREAEEATAKAATDTEQAAIESAVGAESAAVETAEESLLPTSFEAQEIGVEEAVQRKDVEREEQITEEASEPPIIESETAEAVVAGEADQETGEEPLPMAATEGSDSAAELSAQAETEESDADSTIEEDVTGNEPGEEKDKQE
ncbi:MAG TPA: hypothetical protein VLG74_10025, partial [Blastocatellia bacterium]|nr:hypothetical protein [Blastocatellia bacterium]